MSNGKFQEHVTRTQARQVPAVVEAPPADDAACPPVYEAVRRIRSFNFSDVVFRSHTGAAQAFPWSHLRSWLCDETGTQLTLIWPEMVVSLSGTSLQLLQEDLMRRIIAEFRQAKPGEVMAAAPGVPVIHVLKIEAIDAV